MLCELVRQCFFSCSFTWSFAYSFIQEAFEALCLQLLSSEPLSSREENKSPLFWGLHPSKM